MFNLGQGEVPPPEMENMIRPERQMAVEPRAEAHVPAQQAQPAPPGQMRPKRTTRMPARYADFDMNAEAMDSEVSRGAEFGHNGLVGVCGYDKDDIGDRAEVTSLVAALAATLEKLLTAICG